MLVVVLDAGAAWSQHLCLHGSLQKHHESYGLTLVEVCLWLQTGLSGQLINVIMMIEPDLGGNLKELCLVPCVWRQ